MVKYVRTLILLALMLLGNVASAKQPKRIIIFNGYFFNELPSAVKSSVTPQDMKMFFIETPNATKALGMYSPSIELSEESLRYVFPWRMSMREKSFCVDTMNKRKAQIISVSRWRQQSHF